MEIKLEKNSDVVVAGESPQVDNDSTLDLEMNALFRRLGLTDNDILLAEPTAEALSLDQAIEILNQFLENHRHDISLTHIWITEVEALLEGLQDPKSSEMRQRSARICAAVIDGNSVYQEVRATVVPTDDPEMPANTIRMWVIGVIWACGLSAINQFFTPRQPAITVVVYLAQLFGFSMGKFCAALLPKKIFFQDTRYQFTLNPGPWSLKEQSLVTAMANVSYTIPLISQLFFIQRLPIFLGQEWAGSFMYGVCIILSTQLLGFGLAGVCRRFIVWPANMIWYHALAQTAMNKAFVTNENLVANNWKMSQMRFFCIAFAGAFCYYWLPATIMPTMTFFSWITWIKPTSAAIAIVTGTYYFNLGFNPLSSLDYQWFSIIDPFVTPFFVVLQIIAGAGLWGLLVILPTFFTNTWFTAYLPINSWLPYDNTGQVYQTSRILGADHKLNQTAYEAYSPVFLSASYSLRYTGMLGLLPAIFVFTYLWHWDMLAPILKRVFRRKNREAWEGDIHYRLMKQYKEVQDWVYLVIAVLAMALGFIAFYVWPLGLPGWIIPVSFFASLIFVVPVGILCATTGYITDLEILFTIIGGVAVEGDPIGAFVFKVLGKSVLTQAVFFSQDMKLGHYAKVPPRLMLAAQVAGVVCNSIISMAIIEYQITSIPGICDMRVQSRWVCGLVSTTWTSAIIWGAIGPTRLFSEISLYRWIPMGLLAGALWPLPWYFARKRWPQSVFRRCHPVVMMVGPMLWAPLNFSNLWQALPVSFVAGHWAKTRYSEWWNKYNYVLSTALISGIAFSVIIQFLAIDNNPAVTFPSWWGTTQYLKTCDMQDCRYLTVPEGETFGPTEWH